MFFQILLSAAANLVCSILHVNTTGRFPPPLKKEEEKRLIAFSQKGDKAARDKLTEHNLRLVAHIVKKYYNTAAEQDDLISIGTIGLIKAVSTYKDGKVKLATYAAKCIENEILMYFRALKKSALDIPISEPIETDKDGNALTLGDVIADDIDISEDVDLKLETEKLKKFLNTELSERERKIINMRYGLNGYRELPQREVAEKLNISRSYVSRIEKKALEKLRDIFEKGQE